MRTLFFLLLLSACATLNPPQTVPEPPHDDARTETAESGVDKASRKPLKKTARPTLPAPPVPATKDPPCEIDADDKRAAFLQKIDCLTEAAKK